MTETSTTSSPPSASVDQPKQLQEERQKQVQQMLWRQVRLLMMPQIDFLDVFMLIQLTVYIFIVPYTKVEESFNTQAMHDLLFHMTRLDRFDHFEFPGVVPRTFIGSIFVSIIAAPFVKLLQWIIANESSVKFLSLILVRFILGVFSICAQGFFRSGITIKFSQVITGAADDDIDQVMNKVKQVTRKQKSGHVGADENEEEDGTQHTGYHVSIWYALLVMCQFHLIFYMGRPLPNVFALIFAFVGLGYWLRDQYVHMFAVLGVAAAIFRSDLLVFIAPVAVVCLLTRRVGLISGVAVGLTSVSFGIFVSFIVDTYFWQRMVWPEGEVLYYNTVMNKSHEWGVYSPHWYFTSALPRSLLGALVFVPFGIIFHRYRKQSVLPYFISAVLFVALYSMLPHKELRFIFFALPLFNLTAAVGIVQLKRRSKLVSYLIPLVLLVSLIISLFFLYASSSNYYGADALNKLYDREKDNHQPKYVHMDSHVTMNGVTRFLQFNSTWKYSKQEKNVNYRTFSHVLSGNNPEAMDEVDKQFNKVFAVIDTQEGYSGVDFKALKVLKQPKVYCYKRRAFIKPETVTEKELEKARVDKFLAGTENHLVAPIKWYQRIDKLTFTIELPNLEKAELFVTSDHQLLFKAVSSNGNSYLLNIELYGQVDPLDYTITPGAGRTTISIMKAKNEEWPRLIRSPTAKPAFMRIDWDNWVDLSKEGSQTAQDDDDIYPAHNKNLSEGHGILQDKLLPYFIQDDEARTNLIEDIGSFLDSVAQMYCPPILFAFLTTFMCSIMFGLLHLTSVVEFLVKQHRATIEKMRQMELLAKKNK